MSAVKDEAKKLVDRLPEAATWDDLLYEIYIKMKFAEGQRAVREGRVVSHAEAKRRLLKK